MRDLTWPRGFAVLLLVLVGLASSAELAEAAEPDATDETEEVVDEVVVPERRSTNSDTADETVESGAGKLSLDSYVGDGAVEVAAQEVTSQRMGESEGSEPLWDPPGWLQACDIEVVSFGEFAGQRSVIADYYRSQVDAAFLDDDVDWVVMGCVGEGARVLRGVPGSTLAWAGVAYPAGTAPPSAVVDWLIADALARVVVPVQAGSSAPNGEDQPMFYQLEAVAWVDPDVWVPVSASSETFPGGTVVSVTASPIGVTFEALPNDGEESSFADCGDWATEPWSRARDEVLVAQGCTVTFARGAEDHVLRSELRWGLEWSCTCGLGGDFNGQSIVRVNERPVDVLEYLVVES